MTIMKNFYFFFWVAAFLVTTGCASAFKDEEQIEADRITLELNRVHAFGASGAAFTPDRSKLAIGLMKSAGLRNDTTEREKDDIPGAEADS